MIDICDGLAKAYDVEIGVKLRNVFNVLINDVELSDAYLEAAADIVGPQNVTDQQKPVTGSEDFADMLQRVPGAYCIVGHGENIAVHNPEYSLDPEVIPIGASILARVAERRLAG
jgi:hippurate hydrolase